MAQARPIDGSVPSLVTRAESPPPGHRPPYVSPEQSAETPTLLHYMQAQRRHRVAHIIALPRAEQRHDPGDLRTPSLARPASGTFCLLLPSEQPALAAGR
jgi:hypothetical protein